MRLHEDASVITADGEPAVSVIVPVCNGERYLCSCLDSLHAQTLQSSEFICVDDGSTDLTSEIINRYAKIDSRFKLISKPNTGYGHSMNTGLDAAHGTYITSLDSDDLMTNDALQIMLDTAETLHLDFLKADRIYFTGEDPSATGKLDRMGSQDIQYEKVFNPSTNPARWMVKTGLPGFYKMEFLKQHSIRLNETPGAAFQDTGLTAQALFNACRAFILDKAVYLVRRDNEASSTFDKSKILCICDEHDFIREKALHASHQKACLEAAAVMRMDGYWWNLWRIAPEDRELFITRIHNDFIKLNDAGELNETLFSDERWHAVQEILNSPMEFYAQARYGTLFEREKDAAEKLRQAHEKSDKLKREVANREETIKQLQHQLEHAQTKVTRITASKTWKMSRALTWVPRTIKNSLAK